MFYYFYLHTKAPIMKNIFLFLTMAALSITCQTPDDCEKCNEAVNHMKDKIAQNQCNPSFMENAVQRVKDDCGDDASAYIYYLAEMCTEGYAMVANCPSLPSSSQISLIVDTKTGNTTDTMYLFCSWPDGEQKSHMTLGGTFAGFPLEKSVREGHELEFQLTNKNGAVLATEKIRFSFVRPTKYQLARFVEINFDANTGYSLTFIDW